MHLLVMGLGSSFQTYSIPFSSSDLCLVTSFGEKTMEKTALNKEMPVHEWQQKVKHVMKESNSR